MKHLKSFKIFNESYSTRANFNPLEPVHMPHSDNVYGYRMPGEGGDDSVVGDEFSKLMVSKLVSEDDIRWSTYNAVKIALDYWDAISDEEWIEVDEEFKQRVIENPENPAPAIIKFLKRYDNLDEELLRLKAKIEGFIEKDKGFFGRLKDRFKK
jgi:hypothetical protein